MYRMSIHITKEYETEIACQVEFEEIRGELVKHEGLTIDCKAVRSLPVTPSENQ